MLRAFSVRLRALLSSVASPPASCHLMAVSLLIALATPAAAMPITITIDFSASGFQAGAPYDPVTGSVTLTFDTSVAVSDETAGITLNSLSIPLNVPTVSYDYVPLAPGNFIDTLVIGGSQYGAAGLFPGVADFGIVLHGFSSGSPTFSNLDYTATGFPNDLFFTVNGTMIVTGLNIVDEPPTLALMALPLLAMLPMLSRRRSAAA